MNKYVLFWLGQGEPDHLFLPLLFDSIDEAIKYFIRYQTAMFPKVFHSKHKHLEENIYQVVLRDSKTTYAWEIVIREFFNSDHETAEDFIVKHY